tara:strand:- start:1619 stop:2647 length:1029 start_codon:yes stop_codon:yes gene_type:complete
MKILITGNLGYIGSVATEVLSKKYEIVGFDSCLYEECTLFEETKPKFQIRKDIRDVSSKDLEGIDYVVHLAALSNDPLGELNAKLTEEINFLSVKKIADLSKKMEVKRFVYVSSQSMYGISNVNDELDEYESEKKPVTEYAKTKWKAEMYLNSISSDSFVAVSLRPSTVFGVSPRLRSDIVFNNLVGCAFTNNKIEIKSDGTPWRPVVHVRDVVSAINACIIAPNEILIGRSFNVGIKNGNYQVKDLANAVKEVMPNCEIVYTKEHLVDPRSYRVSFKRILEDLGEYYKPKWDLKKGAAELLNLFKKINFSDSDFRGAKTNRIKCLKQKIHNQIDINLRKIN